MADQKAAGVHWRKVHRRMNEHLLFAEDLDGVGGTIDLEIVDSGVEKVKGADDSKDMPWLAFDGAKKRLALNVTNCKTMQSLSGTGVVQEWRGWVRLIVLQTTYFDQKTKKNETTQAIRIAPQRPPARQRKTEQSAKAPANEPPVDPPPPGAPMTDEEARLIVERDREEAARGR